VVGYEQTKISFVYPPPSLICFTCFFWMLLFLYQKNGDYQSIWVKTTLIKTKLT